MHQAFTLNLKPGAFEAYKAHHDSIPTAHADLAEAISESGVKALRIFARGNTLFLCVEATEQPARVMNVVHEPGRKANNG